MAYTDEQITAYRAELDALRQARSRLLTGRQVVRVIIDENSVDYHRIDIPFLKNRITELENIINGVDSPGEFAASFIVAGSKGL